MKKFNLGNPNRIDDRQKANVGSQLFGEDRKTFEIIRNLRNAITHGSQSKGRHSSEIVNYSTLTDGASGRDNSHPEDPQGVSCFNEG
jgi:hypothetical protein